MKFLRKHKKIMIILILLLIVPAISFGRFIYKLIKDHYLITQNFYFQSDLLKEDRAEYTISNWSGVDTYILTINMNSILNDKKYATSDINYKIEYKCGEKVNCYLSKETGTIIAGSNVERNRDSFYLNIIPKSPFSNNEEVDIEVTTTSTSPYKKELSGRFTLKASKYGLSYEITDKPKDIFMILRLTNSLTYYTITEAFGSYNVGDEIEQRVYNALSNDDKKKCTSLPVTLSFDPRVVNLDLTNAYYLKTLANNPSNIHTTRLRKVLKDFGSYKENDLINEETYNSLSQSDKIKVSEAYDYVNKFTVNLDAISSGDIKFYKANKNADYTYPFVTDTPIITIR